jgi:hypothetical protein
MRGKGKPSAEEIKPMEFLTPEQKEAALWLAQLSPRELEQLANWTRALASSTAKAPDASKPWEAQIATADTSARRYLSPKLGEKLAGLGYKRAAEVGALMRARVIGTNS